MRFEITVLLLAGLAQPAAAEPGSGLPARAAPSDYAAQAHTTGASIGAALDARRGDRQPDADPACQTGHQHEHGGP